MSLLTLDPLLRHKAMEIALKAMALEIDGREDPDSVLEWCVNIGWLEPHPTVQGQMLLTGDGLAAVDLWWRRYVEQRVEEQGRRGARGAG